MSSAEAQPPDAQRRSSAVVAIGTMTLIAIVAVTVIGVLARVGGRSAEADEEGEGSSGGPVPTVLAGGYELGTLPDVVSEAFDEPVIGVHSLDEPPEGISLDECGGGWAGPEGPGERKVDRVLATPDGIQIQMTLPEAIGDMGAKGPDGITCTAVPVEGGGWRIDMNGMGTIGEGGGLSFGCCDENGLGTAHASAWAPDGAAWGLLDRGAYYLAYPTSGAEWMSFSWRYTEERMGMDHPPGSRVVWLDARGQELSTDVLGA